MVDPAWRLSAWCRLREPHELSVARRTSCSKRRESNMPALSTRFEISSPARAGEAAFVKDAFEPRTT
jgi:hypothetical protein